MMDKSCQSSADSTTTTTSSSTTTTSNNNTSREQYLRHLNKLSHKISKPIIKKPPFDPHNQTQNLVDNHDNHQQSQPPSQAQPPVQQHQPPVYNINKNDFRDVVQKLTGSPAHERFSTPPPIHAPKPPSSRLQRIRPPPLAHVSNRPPPLLNGGGPPPQPQAMNTSIPITAANSSFGQLGRPVTPLSPLPPFPSVHAAAESPVSAYMRYLQNTVCTFDSNPKQFSGFSPLAPLVSPRWHNSAPPMSHQHQQFPPPQQGMLPPPTSASIPSYPQFPMPTSPLPFGCLNSPRSPYPLLSPGLLFSPSSGQLGFPQLPLSPTVPVPSPRWRAL
ncbi:VQ motif-containing protein 9 [Corylus avellana]|uniref:VQ motif-containing protein 9 n=1 Tax=Corylus avellana TaxID=13451 RepID=UPI00286C3E3B|nr:VQ motif-containing protein 9 [Corylus avellana]